MTKAISMFVYDKEVYKIAIERWRIARQVSLSLVVAAVKTMHFVEHGEVDAATSSRRLPLGVVCETKFYMVPYNA